MVMHFPLGLGADARPLPRLRQSAMACKALIHRKPPGTLRLSPIFTAL
jgi:hypothetical protein